MCGLQRIKSDGRIESQFSQSGGDPLSMDAIMIRDQDRQAPISFPSAASGGLRSDKLTPNSENNISTPSMGPSSYTVSNFSSA
jgi:hypothetical protein